jgi:hypothetical protein
VIRFIRHQGMLDVRAELVVRSLMAPTLAISVKVQAKMTNPRARAAFTWRKKKAPLGSGKKIAPSTEVSR